MVSANALFYGNKNTTPLLRSDLEEKNAGISVQLFGNDADRLSWACEYIESLNIFSGIDLNMGCSVKKVLKAESGCFLMKDLEKVKIIFKKMRAKINGLFSCKMRLGFSEKNKNFLEIAKIAEDEGVDFITLHPRLREKMFSGSVDYKALEKLSNTMKIPVIGSGDIIDYDSLLKIKNCGVSGAMIARGALGNPFIFKQLKNKNYTVNHSEFKRVFKEHGEMILDFYGEYEGIKIVRKTLLQYIKNMPHARHLRMEISVLKDKQEFYNICDKMVV
jgi:tRNA-dihydrouridine synthase B